MTINEYQFFNGVVLNGLVRKGKPLKIDVFPSSGNNAFTINEKVGIYIKYSKKVISPWRFTFLKEHQDEFKIMSELLTSFLILVCNKDGIVCINSITLKKILDTKHESVEWISAARLKRESYEVKGSDGKLKFKININDFPRHVINKL
jgi:hypothetical protein|tara:strand:+ start:1989 stop:2432 length:444 start_codon:yes stop_codon:yes gene_type:complete